jgi:hypothetical protein
VQLDEPPATLPISVLLASSSPPPQAPKNTMLVAKAKPNKRAEFDINHPEKLKFHEDYC